MTLPFRCHKACTACRCASVLSSTGITYLPIAAGGRLARLCPVGLPHFLDASNGSSFYQVAGQQRFLSRRALEEPLPTDWEALREAAGLTAFIAAAITVGCENVAVLSLAHEDPDKFDSPITSPRVVDILFKHRWQTSMELLGAYLGHLFRDRQLVGYCGVVEELMVVDSLDDLIRTLSRCVVRLQSALQNHPLQLQQQQQLQQLHSGLTGSSPSVQRGRFARMSAVSPGSNHDPYLASLIQQYQVQMHSVANLVPDLTSESGPGLPPPPPPPPPPSAHLLQPQQRYGVAGMPSSSAHFPPLQPSPRQPSAAGLLGGGVAAAAAAGVTAAASTGPAGSPAAAGGGGGEK
ncbi:hypothetical protein VOLCADRAFT_107952 [Volvox carteri f. nagariensis]|uniref:Uncharacterized protein n=1 Tax=Volvox carteri f. nagariensis TaxID=3068 RepID=D8UHD9_VOLCA|nr:uncharacterized protein VOLCADRAFT_107952 [Volvox carteri f. nagariensis]EFJ40806.1 hypothetical protein VOLCADRAFT_107952 [Volvox carteri f. nagariensis]|eukprot:XP_002958075.1 hypothetical protein VOLCADRAFT_107952 [Volvox carteri f. nagariensis]